MEKIINDKIKKQIKARIGAPDMMVSIDNLIILGFQPNQIIDIGAYHGEWTKNVYKIFPESQYLMIETMEEKKENLNSIVKIDPSKIQYEIALLGRSDGLQLDFHLSETASSVLEEHFDTTSSKRTLSTQSLDTLLKRLNIIKPDFIKLDTQGYELEILKGAIQALKNAQIILIEVSLLDLHKNTPLIAEVFAFLKLYNFVAYDICSFTRRPLDNALWQTDIIFCKEDHMLRSNKNWI